MKNVFTVNVGQKNLCNQEVIPHSSKPTEKCHASVVFQHPLFWFLIPYFQISAAEAPINCILSLPSWLVLSLDLVKGSHNMSPLNGWTQCFSLFSNTFDFSTYFHHKYLYIGWISAVNAFNKASLQRLTFKHLTTSVYTMNIHSSCSMLCRYGFEGDLAHLLIKKIL